MFEQQILKVISVAQKIQGDNISRIIEIGARDCTETLIFHEHFPQAKIVSFECNPETLPVCRKKTSHIPNISLIEKAVSETDGMITFNQINTSETITTIKNGNPGASSIFKASDSYPVETYVQREITVQSTRLDTFFKQNDIQSVDILWMDIQGAELMALKSLSEHIQKIKMIHLEFEFLEIYTGQPLFQDINSFLKLNGFNLLEFTSLHSYSGDAIYVRKDIRRNIVPVAIHKWVFRLKRKTRHIFSK